MKGDFRPRYASNSGIFARRGDPWVSQREGVKDYRRDPETEDADRDFDQRFHSTGFGPKPAPARAEYKEPAPAPKEEDFARRKASIVRRMNMRMQARAPKVETSAPVRGFSPCAGCRAAQCVAHNRCFGALR